MPNDLIQSPFSLAATNQAQAAVLDQHQSAAVTVYALTGGATLVPESSSDGVTWVTAANVGGGLISTPGVYIGNIAQTGLLGFRVRQVGAGTAVGYMAVSRSAVAGTFSQNTLTNVVSGSTSATNATAASANAYIAAGVTTTTTVKTTPGRLFAIQVTSTGTNATAMNVTDGGSNVIAVIPATAAIGPISIPTGGVPFFTNLQVAGQTGAPALTISYA